MSHLRVETSHGNHILCGGILPADTVKLGQTWQSSSGHTVTVSKVHSGWVEYTWAKLPWERQYHIKDNFNFQCRYCLVLDKPEIPEEFI